MDRIEKLEEQNKTMQRRLETTLDIIMEHFRDTEERMEELTDTVEELQDALRSFKQ